jgi:hypothetical protein
MGIHIIRDNLGGRRGYGTMSPYVTWGRSEGKEWNSLTISYMGEAAKAVV